MSGKKGSTNANVPKGDKRSGLKRILIRLWYSSNEDSEYETDAKGSYVNIKVKINPNGKDDKSNLTAKRF